MGQASTCEKLQLPSCRVDPTHLKKIFGMTKIFGMRTSSRIIYENGLRWGAPRCGMGVERSDRQRSLGQGTSIMESQDSKGLGHVVFSDGSIEHIRMETWSWEARAAVKGLRRGAPRCRMGVERSDRRRSLGQGTSIMESQDKERLAWERLLVHYSRSNEACGLNRTLNRINAMTQCTVRETDYRTKPCLLCSLYWFIPGPGYIGHLCTLWSHWQVKQTVSEKKQNIRVNRAK